MSEIEMTTLRVRRGIAEETPRYDEFQLPLQLSTQLSTNNGASVLDALVWIRNRVDASLAFRYSCINANACKQCMVLVDGKVSYACTTRLNPGVMTIEPLPNKTLIRDLVTNIVPPKERLQQN